MDQKFLPGPLDRQDPDSSEAADASAARPKATLLPHCREVLAQAPVLVVELDARGAIRWVNPYLEQVTGWSLQEIRDSDWFEMLVPEEDRASARDVFRAAMASKPTRGNVNAILTRRGERREIAWNDQVIEDGQGNPALLAIGMDITETIRLKEKAHLAESAIESSPDAIAFADSSARLSYVNSTFVRLWKLPSREEAVGRPATSFWRDSAAAEQVLEALRRDGSWRGELTARLADGSSAVLRLSAHSVCDAQGNSTALMAWFQDVSEARMADQALRQSRELLRRILDSIRTSVILLSAAGVVLEANQSFLNLVRRRREEVVGRSFGEAPWWEETGELERVRACLEQAFTGRVSSADLTLAGAGGQRVVLDMAFRPLYGESGELRIVACGMDITERLESLRVVKESEEKYRQLHQSMRDAFLSVDLQGHVLECNSAFEAMVGYSRQELETLASRALSVRSWPLDDPQVRKRILADGDSGLYETSLRRKDGSVLAVELRTFLVRDREGKPTAMWSIVRDITERKAMEEALRSSEARLREAQRLAGLGSWQLDPTTGELTWSEEIYRIFETTPEEFPGTEAAFLSMVHPDDREMVDQAYRRSLRERTPYSVIHRLLFPDGRIKYVQEHCETVYDEEGHPLRSLGTVQDITARHTIQLKLEASLREKEVLLRELHHRVKNNLQILSSLLHFQSQKTGASELLRDIQDRLRSLQLVHERLYRSPNLARIELGSYLDDLCRQLRLSFHDQCPGARLELQMEPLEVPSQVALAVGMIVTELVVNAFKHGLSGGNGGFVRVALQKTAAGLHLQVEDSGPGLEDPSVLETGSSFGLRVVRDLVAQLGGRLHLQAGPGCRVQIVIPRPADLREPGVAAHRS
jgi:PAS domain S-box-containing protein